MNLQSLTAVLNLIGLIAGGAYLVTNKADSARYDDRPLTAKVAGHDTDIAVLKSEFSSMKETVDSTAKDVKDILKAVRPDDYRPAVIDKSVPLVKGVNANGSPRQ